jgi:hypothetical protein
MHAARQVGQRRVLLYESMSILRDEFFAHQKLLKLIVNDGFH